MSFRKGEFNSEYVFLDDLIFNQPIRRDFVHRVNHWTLMYDKKTYHRTKKLHDVIGSDKKPRPQKGTGKARWGNKKASGKRGGGKAWGHIPKDFT